jgi:hypothetical protein
LKDNLAKPTLLVQQHPFGALSIGSLTIRPLTEVDQFFKRARKVIVPLTVTDILNEQLARKLA